MIFYNNNVQIWFGRMKLIIVRRRPRGQKSISKKTLSKDKSGTGEEGAVPTSRTRRQKRGWGVGCSFIEED
jgi:hypothetical protein